MDQTEQNTKDIGEIKQTLNKLETNHIAHIEKDMQIQSLDIRRLTKQMNQMDMRLWAILILLVGSVVIGVVTNGL